MAAALFSSDGADVIQRVLSPPELSDLALADAALDDVYDIQRTVDFLKEKAAKKVALQFPDNLLACSITIARRLEEATGAKTYILGDTSYGSCCVDEVAAEHVGADALVHYGWACLSPCRRLPVTYVFGRKAVSADLCTEAFRNLFPERDAVVVVFSDVVYDYILGDLETRLSAAYPRVVFCKLCWLEVAPAAGEVYKFGRKFSPDLSLWPDGYSIFYVGGEGATLSNLLLTWPRCTFYSFNPATNESRREGVHVNRALMKRFYLIEKARDAQVVGILVGTLGVSDYLSALSHLKSLIHRAGKKSYLLSMGKLNPAKLANFPEIDIFVLVACPENSLLDSSDFYRPIITPDEMEVACNPAREWGGQCITDFRELLPGGPAHVTFPEINPEDAERTDVSLITGELRSLRFSSAVEETSEEAPSMTLVQRNSNTTVAELGAAAFFLSSRSWQGLDKALGETPVVKAVEGRRGIAIAYEDEVSS
ncbi:2-(3-amino-3-carboxypropyl)histidine synthase subunit 2 [Leptodactylus fuscus]|uniref:2-(3-amino-3-carboxypropyl)histidine synthase subunit 2 n=1 Tax=Leptodactylus fuscus TaxID=238119 RepID=UPI003F4EA5B0